jgi:hypothetical protein
MPLFGKKEEPKFWKYDAKYLGGHAAFANDADGKPYLYPEPDNKVVFESKKVNIEIPLSKIKVSKIATEKAIRARRILLTAHAPASRSCLNNSCVACLLGSPRSTQSRAASDL